MKEWLAIAAVLPFAAATGAQAQMKGLAATEIADVARTRTLDLKVQQQDGAERTAPLMRGLIFQQDLAPNAAVGVGLANIYAKRRAGSDLQVGEHPNRSRKPAVTFTFRF
jgi:hypothetical protein